MLPGGTGLLVEQLSPEAWTQPSMRITRSAGLDQMPGPVIYRCNVPILFATRPIRRGGGEDFIFPTLPTAVWGTRSGSVRTRNDGYHWQ